MLFEIGWFVMDKKGTFFKIEGDILTSNGVDIPSAGDTIYMNETFYIVSSRVFNYTNKPNPTIRINLVLPDILAGGR